jgi:hypothetical protein
VIRDPTGILVWTADVVQQGGGAQHGHIGSFSFANALGQAIYAQNVIEIVGGVLYGVVQSPGLFNR